jgi:hypothetical protein
MGNRWWLAAGYVCTSVRGGLSARDDQIVPPPLTVSAEELSELSYMPQEELTLAVPPTVVAPDACGSREYMHEPDPSVTATAVVETGTVCHPRTFMK